MSKFLQWLKWLTLFFLAVAILGAVLLAAFGGYEIDVNPKEFQLKIKPTTTMTGFIFVGDPKLAEVVERHLGKTKLINVKRKVTYTIKAIKKEDVLIMDTEHEIELKNLSNETLQEDLEIRMPTHYPEPVVVVDGSVLNPLQVSPTFPEEMIRLYRVLIPGQATRQVTYKLRDREGQLPFNSPDLTPRSTLHSELIIEGPPEVMKRLRVDALAFTWRDNWEMSKPHTPNRITYGWRTRYALLPFQGAYIHISLEHQ